MIEKYLTIKFGSLNEGGDKNREGYTKSERKIRRNAKKPSKERKEIHVLVQTCSIRGRKVGTPHRR